MDRLFKEVIKGIMFMLLSMLFGVYIFKMCAGEISAVKVITTFICAGITIGVIKTSVKEEENNAQM